MAEEESQIPHKDEGGDKKEGRVIQLTPDYPSKNPEKKVTVIHDDPMSGEELNFKTEILSVYDGRKKNFGLIDKKNNEVMCSNFMSKNVITGEMKDASSFDSVDLQRPIARTDMKRRSRFKISMDAAKSQILHKDEGGDKKKVKVIQLTPDYPSKNPVKKVTEIHDDPMSWQELNVKTESLSVYDGCEALNFGLIEKMNSEVTCSDSLFFCNEWYSSMDIHKKMLSDKERTDSYRQAIIGNPSLFKGSSVLDVGCGTGILSLFAARAGATKVYAVEASVRMARIAAQIVEKNGFRETIEVIQGMVEKIDHQRIKYRVDVLVSEWMGCTLLSECMLTSVLNARDRFLKPGGAILPDKAVMFVAGFGKGATNIPFWENVYEFDMSPAGEAHVVDDYNLMITEIIDVKDLVTESSILREFDLSNMSRNEVDFNSRVNLKPLKIETCHCHGLVFWFETNFTRKFCKENPVDLSTSPHARETHWCQTLVPFLKPLTLGQGNLDADITITSHFPKIHIHYEIFQTSSEGRKVLILRNKAL